MVMQQTTVQKRINRGMQFHQNVYIAAFSQDGGYGVQPTDQVKHGPLTVKYDEQMITYLGQMCSVPATELLYEVMTKASGAPNEWAAIAILYSAEKTEKQSPAENKRIADIRVSLVEYSDISHLRGGLEAHWRGKFSHVIYKEWQERQVRAGKVVLKFANPEVDATKNIDDARLDI
jgi:hypothetical protein